MTYIKWPNDPTSPLPDAPKWPNEMRSPVPYEPNWQNEAMRQSALLHSAMLGGARAEAKLAKAVEALQVLSCKCTSNCDWDRGDICPSWTIRTVLNELEEAE